MDKVHFSLRYPADTFGAQVMGAGDIFDESQRSKSQEHSDRLLRNEKTQKIEKIEDNQL